MHTRRSRTLAPVAVRRRLTDWSRRTAESMWTRCAIVILRKSSVGHVACRICYRRSGPVASPSAASAPGPIIAGSVIASNIVFDTYHHYRTGISQSRGTTRFLAKATAELASHDSDVQTVARHTFAALETLLDQSVMAAQRVGSIAASRSQEGRPTCSRDTARTRCLGIGRSGPGRAGGWGHQPDRVIAQRGPT